MMEVKSNGAYPRPKLNDEQRKHNYGLSLKKYRGKMAEEGYCYVCAKVPECFREELIRITRAVCADYAKLNRIKDPASFKKAVQNTLDTLVQ
jgi:hypothetical protein